MVFKVSFYSNLCACPAIVNVSDGHSNRAHVKTKGDQKVLICAHLQKSIGVFQVFPQALLSCMVIGTCSELLHAYTHKKHAPSTLECCNAVSMNELSLS
jgi:hypothetical protein